MKKLLACAVLASALLHGAYSQEDLPYGDKLILYGPFGPFRSTSDLNATNICSSGGIYDRPVLQTLDSGWSYNAIGCRVPEDTFLNVSGGVMPIMYSHIPIVPVGFNFRRSTVGPGSALVIDGPLSDFGRMYVPWMIEIVNNTFGANAQLRIVNSLPVNSTVIIENNIFDVQAPSTHLADGGASVMAIGFGGRLTDYFEPSVLYYNARIFVQDNHISVDGSITGLPAAGIAHLSDIYFTTGSSFHVRRNKIHAKCVASAECAGFNSNRSAYLDFSSWEYERGSFTLDENDFTIVNGKGFFVPQLWAPNATFMVSASYNNITITNEKSTSLSEHCITIGQNSMGASATITVNNNKITSLSGNTLIFFQGALDLSNLALISVQYNYITTTMGDPSVYFIDQLTLADKSALNIDNNIFKRVDDAPVTRPYMSLTYDFSLLDRSELSFRNNEMVPTRSTPGPYMVIITESKIANIYPTAFFAICNNNYHGNPADLFANTILRSNVRDKINCNPRPIYTRFPTTTVITTTPAPTNSTTSTATTTSATTTLPPTSAPTTTTAKPTTTPNTQNGADGHAVVLGSAVLAMAAAFFVFMA